MIEEGGGPLRGFGEAPFPWAGREVLNGVEETPTVFISIKKTFQ